MHSLWERVEDKRAAKVSPFLKSGSPLPQRGPEPDIASRLSHLKATNSMQSVILSNLLLTPPDTLSWFQLG